MVGISGPNLRRVIKSCDIGEDVFKKSEGSDATVICSLEAFPLEDAATRLGSVLSTPVPPKISTHTGTVQKTWNLNYTVVGNVNGIAMLENKSSFTNQYRTGLQSVKPISHRYPKEKQSVFQGYVHSSMSVTGLAVAKA